MNDPNNNHLSPGISRPTSHRPSWWLSLVSESKNSQVRISATGAVVLVLATVGLYWFLHWSAVLTLIGVVRTFAKFAETSDEYEPSWSQAFQSAKDLLASFSFTDESTSPESEGDSMSVAPSPVLRSHNAKASRESYGRSYRIKHGTQITTHETAKTLLIITLSVMGFNMIAHVALSAAYFSENMRGAVFFFAIVHMVALFLVGSLAQYAFGTDVFHDEPKPSVDTSPRPSVTEKSTAKEKSNQALPNTSPKEAPAPAPSATPRTPDKQSLQLQADGKRLADQLNLYRLEREKAILDTPEQHLLDAKLQEIDERFAPELETLYATFNQPEKENVHVAQTNS